MNSYLRRVGEKLPGLPFVAAMCALILLGLIARRAWVADDAFITLRTVDHFVHGRGLVWNTGFRVQVFTHPLWMFLLALPYALTREPYFGTIALSLLVDLVVVVVLFRDLLRDDGARVFALVALATSQAFVDFGTSGLENPLSHLLLLLAYREYLREPRSAVRTLIPVGLLLVNRHDLALMVLPLVVDVLRSLRGAPAATVRRSLIVLLAPLALWTVFATFYFGAPLPNTAYAKLGGALPRSLVLHNGLAYLASSFVYDATTPLTVLAGIVAGMVGSGRHERKVALGIALYVAYVVFAGGDFMRGRFFTAPLLLAVVLLGERFGNHERSFAMPAAVVWLTAFSVVTQSRPSNGTSHVDVRGIADERAFWAAGMGIENAFGNASMPNHPNVHTGRQIALEASRGNRQLGRANTAGLVGFYAGPEAYVIEWYGLADPVLAREPAIRQLLTRPGHLLRHVDDDYVAMMEDVTNGRPFRCRGEPVRCRLLEDALLATHAPLLSKGRAGAILRLSLGPPDWGTAFEHYRRPRLKVIALADAEAAVPEGASWDGPNTHPFFDDGIAIRLPSPSNATSIRLALDHNDGYRVFFQRNGETLAELEIPEHGGTGMVHRHRAVPERARGRFDRLLIEPTRGDGSYSVGHVRLE